MDKTIQITFDTKGILGITAATAALKGLNSVLSSVAEGVKEAFTVQGYRDYLQTVSRFGKSLTDQLLTMQMAFGRMKVAIAQAFAPLAQLVVPYINQAINAIIRFAGVVRQFLSGLFAGITGTNGLAAAADQATDAENSLAAAATSAGRAARRSLMGLDQLERLNAPTGGGGSSGGYSFPEATDQLIAPGVQQAVDKVLAFLAPLLAIDLTPLKTALQGLWEAFSNLAVIAGQALQSLYETILVPFAAWVIETLAPALTDGFAAGLDTVAVAAAALLAGSGDLWEALKPVVEYIGQTAVLALGLLKVAFEELSAVIAANGPEISRILENIGIITTAMWDRSRPALENFRSLAGDVFSGLTGAVCSAVDRSIGALDRLTGFMAEVFTFRWQDLWVGLKDFLRGMINAIIGLLNTMILRLVSALNAVIGAANKLSFKVPSWVPGIGGNSFGFYMKTISATQIPYLARGAVLPANKPFLAMVGDQRHGTNVEAPLSTIEEAVAGVMEQQTAAILTGFEASVGVQREILEAVLGIRIGDEVIGRAVSRYNHKQAVMRGGTA